jgi:NAD(P)-dependent dehydrogenase (short-subunit alcohol dehydrogenase family)
MIGFRDKSPRVINVASVAVHNGAINFDDLQSERNYRPMIAYEQSKLANLMFSFEFQRHSDVAKWGISSIAAHPGVSRTDLLPNGAGSTNPAGLIRRWLWFLFQPAA